MRRALCVSTAVIAVVLVQAPSRAQDLVLERFRDSLDALRTQAGIPALSATIVGTNDIVWEAAFGKQDVERSIAARPGTPFHLDGLTQTFTATLILGCVETSRLGLDERISQRVPDAPEPNATIRQLLSHTSDGTFKYRLDRLNPLAGVVPMCARDSFRTALARLFDQLAMIDSVPGPDVVQLSPDEVFTGPALERYGRVLGGLAIPYAVDSRGQPSPSRYSASTLQASGGIVSTTRDLAQFARGLMTGHGVAPDITALMWTPAVGANGQPLPHGLGWFVQSYNGETVVWQFGVSDNASSSLMLTVPGRGLTLVLLANSDGLSRPYPLAAGDVTVSPFARLFLGSFVRVSAAR